jgi:hypothetical protein
MPGTDLVRIVARERRYPDFPRHGAARRARDIRAALFLERLSARERDALPIARPRELPKVESVIPGETRDRTRFRSFGATRDPEIARPARIRHPGNGVAAGSGAER